MKSFVYAAPIAVLILSINTACSNPDISNVKNSYIDAAQTTALSQLLDNRNICKTTTWSSSLDNNKRNVVQYECVLKGTDDYFSKERSSYIENSAKDYERSLTSLNKEIDSLKNVQVNGDPSLNDEIDFLEKQLREPASIKPPAYEDINILSIYINNLKSLLNRVEDLEKEFDEEALKQLITSEEFNKANVLDRDTRDAISSLKAQYMHMAGKPKHLQQSYKKSNIDPRLAAIYQEIPNIKRILASRIEENNTKIQIYLEGHLKSMRAKLEAKKEERAARAAEIMKQLPELQQKLESVRAGYDASSVKLKAESIFPKNLYLSETFQWIVNKEGISTLISSEICGVEGKKRTALFRRNRPEHGYTEVARSKAGNIDAYIKELVGAPRPFTLGVGRR